MKYKIRTLQLVVSYQPDKNTYIIVIIWMTRFYPTAVNSWTMSEILAKIFKRVDSFDVF
ncbi:hypothetical protein FM106_15235 [Brachybacterium faecium]|nr:hypothetical protein FM106_15235 [Brachybacterium faecium]